MDRETAPVRGPGGGMFPETGEYHGYAGLREFTSNQAEAFEQMSVQPAEFVDAGDQIVVPVRFGGTARAEGGCGTQASSSIRSMPTCGGSETGRSPTSRPSGIRRRHSRLQ